MAGDWTNEQNDAIVSDYFAMLAADIVGRPYRKAEHNRRLQVSIGRPRGSIEYMVTFARGAAALASRVSSRTLEALPRS